MSCAAWSTQNKQPSLHAPTGLSLTVGVPGGTAAGGRQPRSAGALRCAVLYSAVDTCSAERSSTLLMRAVLTCTCCVSCGWLIGPDGSQLPCAPRSVATYRMRSMFQRTPLQAQTVANFYLAWEQDLAIVPVLNKIDMDSADPQASGWMLKTSQLTGLAFHASKVHKQRCSATWTGTAQARRQGWVLVATAPLRPHVLVLCTPMGGGCRGWEP